MNFAGWRSATLFNAAAPYACQAHRSSAGIVRKADCASRAGTYVDRILRGHEAGGASRSDCRQDFEMAVHLKTAKALGIEVPTNLLLLADEVIE
jgi:ABC-type uncharacterized transport system substrate-binding protein